VSEKAWRRAGALLGSLKESFSTCPQEEKRSSTAATIGMLLSLFLFHLN